MKKNVTPYVAPCRIPIWRCFPAAGEGVVSKKNKATYTRGRSCLLRSKKENAKLLQLGNRRRDLNFYFYFLKGGKKRKKGKKQKKNKNKNKTSLHAHSHRRYKVKREEGEERMRWTGSKGIFSIEESQLRG